MKSDLFGKDHVKRKQHFHAAFINMFIFLLMLSSSLLFIPLHVTADGEETKETETTEETKTEETPDAEETDKADEADETDEAADDAEEDDEDNEDKDKDKEDKKDKEEKKDDKKDNKKDDKKDDADDDDDEDEEEDDETAVIVEKGPGNTIKLGERLIPLKAKVIDLSGINLSRCDMDAVFSRMENLEKVTMIDCGLKNSEYAALQDAHPGIRIIWEIRFSKVKLRTDAVGFSTFRGGARDQPLTEKDAYYLRYCRDMVGLDLGHNPIRDLSFLQYMHDLKVFIIVDDPGLTDISMLKHVRSITYLEIFKNSITDIDALAYLKDLEDLNFSRNPVSDVSPITDLPKLRRATFMETNVSGEDIAALKKSCPNVRIVTTGINSLAGGWREDAHYWAMRRLLIDNEENETYHKD